MKNPAEVNAIIQELERLYPDALCSLQYKKDYELLFAVRLSAQCTDARVNQVTPALFARFPTLESFARASEEEVGEYVHSCGFWRAKAHDLVASAQMLLRDFGGKVPDTMEDLLRLPGVGRCGRCKRPGHGEPYGGRSHWTFPEGGRHGAAFPPGGGPYCRR